MIPEEIRAAFNLELNNLCKKYNVTIIPQMSLGLQEVQPEPTPKGTVEDAQVTEKT